MFRDISLKGVTDMIRTYAVVLIISVAVIWTGGCQEEQASSGDKMARLTAVENRDLQSTLQAEKQKKDEEIKNLNTQFQAEMKKKDDEIKKLSEQLKKAQALIQTQASAQASLTQAEIKKRDNEIQNLKDEAKRQDDEIKNIEEQLSQCKKVRDAKMEDIQKELGDQYMSVMTNLAEKNSELMAEVDQLKAELASTKGNPVVPKQTDTNDRNASQ